MENPPNMSVKGRMSSKVVQHETLDEDVGKPCRGRCRIPFLVWVLWSAWVIGMRYWARGPGRHRGPRQEAVVLKVKRMAPCDAFKLSAITETKIEKSTKYYWRRTWP
jgi:hypothetical protein